MIRNKTNAMAERNAQIVHSALLWRSAVGHPIRAPGLKHGDFGDKKFRCLSACASF